MKIIEVIADSGHLDTIKGIAEQQEVTEHWHTQESEDGRCVSRLLVDNDIRQVVLDALQGVLSTSETARINVIPIEASMPKPQVDETDEQDKKSTTAISREELYNTIEKNAHLDRNHLLLVVLSTIVAAIGLLENNIAVVIGAMVIAPLLGPNIALALGSALGDRQLIWDALKTNLVGIITALIVATIIGFAWPLALNSPELLSRTDVGLDGVALALASGAAAVLSLTTGLPSVLVGVMVAVALLPPTAAMGLMIGGQQYELASGAGLLLAVNIVCINLSAKLAFFMRGIKPRTWLEQKKARQSMAISIVIWILSLSFLVIVIYLRQPALLAK